MTGKKGYYIVSMCGQSNMDIETLTHIFFDCKVTMKIWRGVTNK